MNAQIAQHSQLQPLSRILDAGWPTLPLNAPDAKTTRRGKTVLLGKAPYESNWTRCKPQTRERALMHAEDGNTGIYLGRKIGDGYLCAYDIDRQNLPNDLDDIPALVNAIAEQLEVSVSELVIHQSGNDGLHIFFLSSEPKLRGHIELHGIKVELKSKGQQVVAPGSIHPETGNVYQIHPDSADHANLPSAPERLIAEFRKSTRVHGGPQIVPPSRLMWMAEQLAETDAFLLYDDWLKGGMAFHAASGGDGYGLDAWITASHAGEDDYCTYKWGTFGDGDISDRTLNWYLEQAGIDTTEAPRLTSDEVAEFVTSDFAELSHDEITKPKLKREKKRLYSFEELIALPEPVWLVDHAIPQNGLVVLYGPPKSAKTFLALDIALCIGTGQTDLHGFNVKPGKVLYVLAEGGAPMMGNRGKAWLHYHDETKADVAVLPSGVTLGNRRGLDELFQLAGYEWDLVIVDTLARCMEGDENSVKDMNLAIKGSDYIREKTGAAVLLVHHSGKDQSKGMRGSTALLGAVDATIRMKGMGNNGFELSVKELRHGEPPPPVWLNLQSTGGSAVLHRGQAQGVDTKGDVLATAYGIGMLTDSIPRKELADKLAEDLGINARTARRRIVDTIPLGAENAIEYDHVAMWREPDVSSSSPKAEIVRKRRLD